MMHSFLGFGLLPGAKLLLLVFGSVPSLKLVDRGKRSLFSGGWTLSPREWCRFSIRETTEVSPTWSFPKTFFDLLIKISDLLGHVMIPKLRISCKKGGCIAFSTFPLHFHLFQAVLHPHLGSSWCISSFSTEKKGQKTPQIFRWGFSSHLPETWLTGLHDLQRIYTPQY